MARPEMAWSGGGSVSTEPTAGPAPAPPRLWRRVTRGLPALAIVLAPTLITLLMFHFRLGASLFDATPVANDEIGFWLEIATFREAGFNGGYHSTNEQAAPARFCRFDPRGPGFAVLYGLLAVVLGWEPWSGAVFNLLCLAAATAVWLWVCRPGPWQAAAAALLVATFWPCLLYLPLTMQEGLHCAFAFLAAAAVQRSLVSPPRSAGQFVVPLLTIAACATVRVTWALVLLPWAILSLRGFSRRGRVVGGAAVAATFCAVVLLSRWLNAPHVRPDGVGFVPWFLHALRESPRDAMSFFADHMASNLRNFVFLDSGSPLEVLQRYVILGLLLASAAALWFGRKSKDGDGERLRRWLFAGGNLAVLTAAVILAYDVTDWRDYRVLSPHLLLSLLVLACGPSWTRVLVPCCAHLLFLPGFLAQYAGHHLERVTWDRELVAAFRAEIGDLRYDPSRPGWDNTVLMPVESFTYPMVAVHAGMGVNCVIDWDSLRLPPRSRYMILPDDDLRDLSRRVRLRRVRLTQLGWLCVNLEAEGSSDQTASEEGLQDDRHGQ